MTIWEERLLPILAQLDALTDELACFDYLIACAGERGWILDEQLRQACYQVKGCDSKMWVTIAAPKGCLRLQADSDSMLLRGILALLIRIYDGTPAPVSAAAGLQLLTHPRLTDCFSAKQRKTLENVCLRLEGDNRKDENHEESH